MDFGKKKKNTKKMTKILFSGSTSKQHIAMKNEVIRADIFVSEAHTKLKLKIIDSEVFPMLLQKNDFSFWTKLTKICAL